MSEEIALKKLEMWLNFSKFILGTFIIGLIVINVNSEIQQREITLKEQNHLAQFTQEALKENVASRLLLAQYYANVTQSTALKEGWQSYLKIVQKEYDDKLQVKKDAEVELTKLEAEKKAGQADENVEKLISIKRLKIDRVTNQLELPSMKQQYIPEQYNNSSLNHYGNELIAEKFARSIPDITERIISQIEKFVDTRSGNEEVTLLFNSINNNTSNKSLDSMGLLKSVLMKLRGEDGIKVISSSVNKEFYIVRVYIDFPSIENAYTIELRILTSSGDTLTSYKFSY